MRAPSLGRPVPGCFRVAGAVVVVGRLAAAATDCAAPPSRRGRRAARGQRVFHSRPGRRPNDRGRPRFVYHNPGDSKHPSREGMGLYRGKPGSLPSSRFSLEPHGRIQRGRG